MSKNNIKSWMFSICITILVLLYQGRYWVWCFTQHFASSGHKCSVIFRKIFICWMTAEAVALRVCVSCNNETGKGWAIAIKFDVVVNCKFDNSTSWYHKSYTPINDIYQMQRASRLWFQTRITGNKRILPITFYKMKY